MRDLFHPKRSDIELTAVMHALSDPTRLDIVRQLADGEEQACGTFGVGVAKSTLVPALQGAEGLRRHPDPRGRHDPVADLAPGRPGRPLPRPARRHPRCGHERVAGSEWAHAEPDGLGTVTSWRRLGTIRRDVGALPPTLWRDTARLRWPHPRPGLPQPRWCTRRRPPCSEVAKRGRRVDDLERCVGDTRGRRHISQDRRRLGCSVRRRGSDVRRHGPGCRDRCADRSLRRCPSAPGRCPCGPDPAGPAHRWGADRCGTDHRAGDPGGAACPRGVSRSEAPGGTPG